MAIYSSYLLKIVSSVLINTYNNSFVLVFLEKRIDFQRVSKTFLVHLYWPSLSRFVKNLVEIDQVVTIINVV